MESKGVYADDEVDTLREKYLITVLLRVLLALIMLLTTVALFITLQLMVEGAEGMAKLGFRAEIEISRNLNCQTGRVRTVRGSRLLGASGADCSAEGETWIYNVIDPNAYAFLET